MEIHEYASLFPMCSEAEIQELAADIKQNGLRQPIVIDADEKILDGRNRAAACKIAGVDPTYEPYVGTDAEKLSYVCSVNIHRRHLSTAQRAEIAAKIATMNVGDNQHGAKKKEGGSNEPPSKPVSTKQAATLMNVSPASVKRAKAAATAKDASPKGATTGIATTKPKKEDVSVKPSDLSSVVEDAARKLDRLRRRRFVKSCADVMPTRLIYSLLSLYTENFTPKKHPALYEQIRSTFEKYMPGMAEPETEPSPPSAVLPVQRALPTIQKPAKRPRMEYVYSIGECGYELYVCSIYRQKVSATSGDVVSLCQLSSGQTSKDDGESWSPNTPRIDITSVSEIEWHETTEESYETDINRSGRTRELDLSRFEPRDGGGQYLYFEPGRVCYYDETAMNLILKMQASEPARNNNEATADETW